VRLAGSWRRARLRTGCVALSLLALALTGAADARAGTSLFVGAAENDALTADPVLAKSRMDLAALAGFGTVRVALSWTRGETALGTQQTGLRNAVTAAQLDGVRLIASIYPQSWREAPLTAQARAQFAAFAASVARAFPAITDFIVGNEPNLNLFWMPQFGPNGADVAARSYELLLARTYDAIKAVSPDLDVIGGALASHGEDKPDSLRPTHSPTAFIADLGAAYRASHRRRPIMDAFAIHPYLIPSSLPPTFAHPRTTTITIADYPKLVRLLTQAFAGTAQRGETLPIVYDEFGYQSRIPTAKRSFYTHLGSRAARDAISESEQAAYYRQAFALAACEPTVAGILIFHVVDERDARAWQSGVYYSDGTPKTSLAAVRRAALAAAAGETPCAAAKTTDDVADVVFRAPTPTEPTMLEADFTCAEPCTYQLRILDAGTSDVAAEVHGNAVGPFAAKVPAAALSAGTYEYALRVFKCGKPGTAHTLFSSSFAVGAAAAASGASAAGAPVDAQWLPTLLPVAPAS